MKREGPSLEPLLRHLADCPPEFLDFGTVDVVAIVCDSLRRIDPDRAPEQDGEPLRQLRACDPDHLAAVAVMAWLLSNEWFVGRTELLPDMWKLLLSDRLQRLAKLQKPGMWVEDPDRREEWVRTCLAHLGFRPAGETAEQASDRLSTLDSAERDRLLRATAAAERRAREVREAMARKRALESASRYGE